VALPPRSLFFPPFFPPSSPHGGFISRFHLLDPPPPPSAFFGGLLEGLFVPSRFSDGFLTLGRSPSRRDRFLNTRGSFPPPNEPPRSGAYRTLFFRFGEERVYTRWNDGWGGAFSRHDYYVLRVPPHLPKRR